MAILSEICREDTLASTKSYAAVNEMKETLDSGNTRCVGAKDTRGILFKCGVMAGTAVSVGGGGSQNMCLLHQK